MNYKIDQIKRLIESLDSYEIKELINYLTEKEDMYIDGSSIEEIARRIERGDFPETRKLLMLRNRDGWSVAHELAYHSYRTNWRTDDKDILMLQDNKGWSVAHALAFGSCKTNWITNNKNILMLQDNEGWSVAHVLAYQHPTWKTHNHEILSLMDENGKTVGDILRKKGKI